MNDEIQKNQNPDLPQSQVAHTWHTGLGLTYANVDLGDCITYDLLRVLGQIAINEKRAEVAQ